MRTHYRLQQFHIAQEAAANTAAPVNRTANLQEATDAAAHQVRAAEAEDIGIKDSATAEGVLQWAKTDKQARSAAGPTAKQLGSWAMTITTEALRHLVAQACAKINTAKLLLEAGILRRTG